MGLLSDFLVATPRAASEYEYTQLLSLVGVRTNHVVSRHRGITPLEIELLWAVLAKRRWNSHAYRLEACDILPLDSPNASPVVKDLMNMMRPITGKNSSRSDASLFRFPLDLVALLQAIDDDATFSNVTAAWSRRVARATRTQWTKVFTIRVLARLIELSHMVKPRGRQLFLWLSA